MCPELAEIGRRRLEERHVCLIGTLRADGSPRISPVEPYLVAGDLVIGMMAGSRKAADLLRDPRLVVHSTVTRWEADEGGAGTRYEAGCVSVTTQRIDPS